MFKALQATYSVQIWSGFAKYFSSYRVISAKSGQFQACPVPPNDLENVGQGPP